MAFSWLAPLNLIRARRHILVTWLYDSTNRKRDEWVGMRRRDHDPSGTFALQRPLGDRFSFLILGDTGEGDASQMVLVDKIQQEGKDAAFTIIAGDVIYPSGRSAEYRAKFYVPYRNVEHDIYAVPGNHDWYDELHGFLIHFCDSNRKLRAPDRVAIKPEKLGDLRRIRRNTYVQPNMYFTIEHPRLQIVCIDTGVKGGLGRAQEQWLRRVSADPRPKVLITGFPFYVDGGPGKVSARIRALVARSNYVLVVGGDKHNFQAYELKKGKSSVWYLVNGGGGAYASPTYGIPPRDRMNLDGSELQPVSFTCYPPPTVAPPSGRLPGKLLRLRQSFLRKLPGWLLDDDAAPYRRSFVKVTLGRDTLEVTAFGIKDFGKEALEEDTVWEAAIPL